MELQCKERVDLLLALGQSRAETNEAGESPNVVSAVNYPDLSKPPPPPLPLRPSMLQKKGSQSPIERSQSSPQIPTAATTIPYTPPITLPVPPKQVSRTPSPEKRNRMLTTLRGTKDGKKPTKSPRTSGGRRPGPPAASKAAGLAWDSTPRTSGQNLGQSLPAQGSSTTTLESYPRGSFGESSISRREVGRRANGVERNLGESSTSRREVGGRANGDDRNLSSNGFMRPPSPAELISFRDSSRPNSFHAFQNMNQHFSSELPALQSQTAADLKSLRPPTPTQQPATKDNVLTKVRTKSPVRPKAPGDFLSYRNEYPPTLPSAKLTAQYAARSQQKVSQGGIYSNLSRPRSPQNKTQAPSSISRRPVANSARTTTQNKNEQIKTESSESCDENTSSSREVDHKSRRATRKNPKSPRSNESPISPSPDEADRNSSAKELSAMALDDRIQYIRNHLPKGVDEHAAKQIFIEIVVQGDEVHWDDVAGLDVAKKALKEAVVYPFLRPDLFMGLREPARGMLLFGPPGTGKTMLARAVATESKSTFFAISASSLTSKWLGESEKLVRALFSLAKALAPSIIFVDEIDSLLSSRGGSSEHEATRRIKTEFLIQWSDLQRAAAGKAQTDKEKQEGDPSRVLVLAATNLPWAIDEAARRRFVRRQYIPLPEGNVRATQLRTLLSHQKHELNNRDIQVLVELTDGTSPEMLRIYISLLTPKCQASLAPTSPL